MVAAIRTARAGAVFAAALLYGCSVPAPPVRTESSGAVVAAVSPLMVRVLDVGQGDATFIENGGSVVFIDGGPDMATFGRHLDRLSLNNDTVDVVVITHAHIDHYNGLRELFRTSRRITVRYVFESRDLSPNTTLASLRDSILARGARGQLVYRDTDNPCGDGSDKCSIELRGGARLHVMRPNPAGDSPNNRSTPVKLVGPDSASFTMWFAGDAESQSIAWFDAANYDVNPGMRVTVLKGNHHGSCGALTRRYLALTDPDFVTFSLAGGNEYGHVHAQTKSLLNAASIPWYRTDQNGDIVIVSPGTPGGGYSVTPARGARDASGLSDRRASPTTCN